ncbi:MAG: DUF4286 family protein [Parvularculaceae bacterium]
MASGAVMYEVIVKVAPDAREAYLAWLRPHVQEMLGFDGFLSADIFTNTEDDCEITSLYRLENRAAMDAYLAGPAQRMRADGAARFGDKISASRRILLKA